MKNASKKFLILFLTLTCALTLTNCDYLICNDDDTPNENHYTDFLVNKWWYKSDNSAKIYFHANGNFEQTVPSLINTSTGHWDWIDESEGILKIDYDENDGQSINEIWIKINDINEDLMIVQQSADGESYNSQINYVDPNND